MSLEINIPAIYSDTFGIYGQISRFPGVTTNGDENGSAGEFTIPEIARTEFELLSYLGTPIESPIFFEAGEYRKFNLQGELVKVKRNRLMLPASTLIEVSREKKASIIPANNGNEEHTQLYGHTSYRIRMYGICLPEPNRSAKDQYAEILGFDDLMDSIKVSSPYLLEHGITEITILRMNAGQVKGSPKVRAFQIEAKSEKPAELIIQ